jgi:hypothetical protein
MWISVNCQLAIVTVNSDIVEVLWKVPHIFTNAECADMLYVYGICDGSATAAIEECSQPFPMHKIPDCRVLSRVFNTLRKRVMLSSALVSSEWACQQHVEEQENLLEKVQRSTTTSTRRLSTHVWRTLHDDGFYPFHPQCLQNLHPGESAMHLEFCHWLHTNRKLLPLLLFTDEASFTRNEINNTYNVMYV